MTETQAVPPAPEPAAEPSPWDVAFARLRERFPRVKDTILFCVHALLQNRQADLVDLKAQASLHGLRITAASRNAARVLLDPSSRPQRRPRAALPAPAVTLPTSSKASPPERPAARREADGDEAIEQLLRQVVARIRAEADARTAHLRQAMEQVLELIDDVLS